MDDAKTDVTEAVPSALADYPLVGSLSMRRVRLVDAHGATHRVDGDRVGVGSHARNDVVLADDSVSRFHCEITLDGDGLRVRDLGSKNGTRVDGVRVERAWLRPGNTLTLGRAELRLEDAGDLVEVPLHPGASYGGLVGRSTAMRRLYAQLDKVRPTDLTVLIEGESGTGKELVAEAIHGLGPRGSGPFVVIDCGALPPNLIASELFGHEKGAFTGAIDRRLGAFEAADGGTLFLDEIGELPLDLQPTLLRALETRAVRRVGSTESVPVDVRVLAATNRALREEVNEGRFRPDLYHRVAVVSLHVAPLRERPDDLPVLVEALLERLDAPADVVARLTAPSSIARLRRHRWPGNVRELRNVLRRAVAFDEDAPVFGHPPARTDLELPDVELGWKEARDRAVASFERRWLRRLMERHDGHVANAASAAGVARQYLHRLLVRHGMK